MDLCSARPRGLVLEFVCYRLMDKGRNFQFITHMIVAKRDDKMAKHGPEDGNERNHAFSIGKRFMFTFFTVRFRHWAGGGGCILQVACESMTRMMMMMMIVFKCLCIYNLLSLSQALPVWEWVSANR